MLHATSSSAMSNSDARQLNQSSHSGQFMAHSTHLAAEPWSLALWPTIAILLLTCLYLRGWLRVRSNSTNALSFWQASSFLSGLLLIWFAVGSPLAALDMQLLTAHMVQHL